MAELDTGIAELLAKKAERKVSAEERRKERSDKGEVNYLQLERSEHGLYSVRYVGGGLVPKCLNQFFTHKQKLLDTVQSHYGNLDLVRE